MIRAGLGVAIICWFWGFNVAGGQNRVVAERQTTASEVKMTVNNVGIIGNSFKGSYGPPLNYSSCERGTSGIEHLFNGGLWIGANVGGQIIVSTGAKDDSRGYDRGKAGFEFVPSVGQTLRVRSSLQDNPNFSIAAISHEDFLCDFTDSIDTERPVPDIENGPLGASVHLETYNWNYSFANFFVILNFTITNSSTRPWENVYIGYWTDPVIRNVNITPAGSGGTAFYDKGGNGYIDSLYMAYEFDATGDVGYTDSYFAVKFLGAEYQNRFWHPVLDSNANFVNFNTWIFRTTAGILTEPQNDNERYTRMRTSLARQPNWGGVGGTAFQIAAPSNRSMFVSAGPFPYVAPGEKVNIVFAVVLAPKTEDGRPTKENTEKQRTQLVRNAAWAQQAYNGEDINFNGILDAGEDATGDGKLTRFILPSPPEIPKTRIVTEPGKIKVYWTRASEESVDPISRKKDFEGYRIYKTAVGFELQAAADLVRQLNLVAQFDLPGNGRGYDNGFSKIQLAEPVKFEGDPNEYVYLYEFNNVLSGWQHAVVVTAFDQGDPSINLEPLESSLISALKRVFPGTKGNRGFVNGDPFVYPNPYYGHAAWEGSAAGQDLKKVYFANLPPKCQVRVYNVSGDLIYNFEHTEDYNGKDHRWYSVYSDTKQTLFSGGEHPWNLLSNDAQIIARGLYIFVVKDSETGDVRRGKFVIIR